MQTAPPRRTLLLEAVSLVPLAHLLPQLIACLHAAGIWAEMAPSDAPQTDATGSDAPGMASLRLETSLHAMPSLYTALIRSGLRLGTSAHTALATLCSFAHIAPAGNRDLRLDIRSLSTEQHLGSLLHAISA